MADRWWFRERGEEEESGVEGLRREVKSTADEERCIQAKAQLSLECDSVSLIVGEWSTTGRGPGMDWSRGAGANDGSQAWGNATSLRLTGGLVESRW